MSTKEKKSLIDQLLDNADAVLDAAKRPFVKKKVKRAFESALDSAAEAKMNAEYALNSLRKSLIDDPENANSYINQIAEKRSLISDAENTIEILEAERNELF